MVKSGLEFILKFTEPLQRYLLSCQANLAILGRYFCSGQQQLWRGLVNFKIKNTRPLFTIIFKSKMLVSRPEILSSILILAILGGLRISGEMFIYPHLGQGKMKISAHLSIKKSVNYIILYVYVIVILKSNIHHYRQIQQPVWHTESYCY